MKFIIIASGFNCVGLSRKCIESVQKQTYRNFKAVFISDGSTDGTLGIQDTNGINDERLCAEVHEKNLGAAKRRLDAIREYSKSEEDVIIFLGLDDELLPGALERIKLEYDLGKWMTYGNWVNQWGKVPLSYEDLKFDEETHKNRDYRKVKYRSTAPNTFKRFLFDHIPEEDFKINGKWIDSTTESEVMFSCLEMCGKERIGLIKEPIYLYNEALPNGTLKRLGVAYKYNIYNTIIARPKRDQLFRGISVSKEVWEERANNLQERRRKHIASTPMVVNVISDYKKHLSKIEVGKTLLDVGCGSRALMHVAPDHCNYMGIDPFPVIEDEACVKMAIEECTLADGSFETVCMFAALDNVYDFKKAIHHIKRVASKNVLFLTGVGIEPDQYHTIKITEDLLINEMKPFKVGHLEYLAPKVLLIEFIK